MEEIKIDNISFETNFTNMIFQTLKNTPGTSPLRGKGKVVDENNFMLYDKVILEFEANKKTLKKIAKIYMRFKTKGILPIQSPTLNKKVIQPYIIKNLINEYENKVRFEFSNFSNYEEMKKEIKEDVEKRNNTNITEPLDEETIKEIEINKQLLRILDNQVSKVDGFYFMGLLNDINIKSMSDTSDGYSIKISIGIYKHIIEEDVASDYFDINNKEEGFVYRKIDKEIENILNDDGEDFLGINIKNLEENASTFYDYRPENINQASIINQINIPTSLMPQIEFISYNNISNIKIQGAKEPIKQLMGVGNTNFSAKLILNEYNEEHQQLFKELQTLSNLNQNQIEITIDFPIINALDFISATINNITYRSAEKKEAQIITMVFGINGYREKNKKYLYNIEDINTKNIIESFNTFLNTAYEYVKDFKNISLDNSEKPTKEKTLSNKLMNGVINSVDSFLDSSSKIFLGTDEHIGKILLGDQNSTNIVFLKDIYNAYGSYRSLNQIIDTNKPISNIDNQTLIDYFIENPIEKEEFKNLKKNTEITDLIGIDRIFERIEYALINYYIITDKDINTTEDLYYQNKNDFYDVVYQYVLGQMLPANLSNDVIFTESYKILLIEYFIRIPNYIESIVDPYLDNWETIDFKSKKGKRIMSDMTVDIIDIFIDIIDSSSYDQKIKRAYKAFLEDKSSIDINDDDQINKEANKVKKKIKNRIGIFRGKMNSDTPTFVNNIYSIFMLKNLQSKDIILNYVKSEDEYIKNNEQRTLMKNFLSSILMAPMMLNIANNNKTYGMLAYKGAKYTIQNFVVVSEVMRQKNKLDPEEEMIYNSMDVALQGLLGKDYKSKLSTPFGHNETYRFDDFNFYLNFQIRDKDKTPFNSFLKAVEQNTAYKENEHISKNFLRYAKETYSGDLVEDLQEDIKKSGTNMNLEDTIEMLSNNMVDSRDFLYKEGLNNRSEYRNDSTENILNNNNLEKRIKYKFKDLDIFKNLFELHNNYEECLPNYEINIIKIGETTYDPTTKSTTKSLNDFFGLDKVIKVNVEFNEETRIKTAEVAFLNMGYRNITMEEKIMMGNSPYQEQTGDKSDNIIFDRNKVVNDTIVEMGDIINISLGFGNKKINIFNGLVNVVQKGRVTRLLCENFAAQTLNKKINVNRTEAAFSGNDLLSLKGISKFADAIIHSAKDNGVYFGKDDNNDKTFSSKQYSKLNDHIIPNVYKMPYLPGQKGSGYSILAETIRKFGENNFLNNNIHEIFNSGELSIIKENHASRTEQITRSIGNVLNNNSPDFSKNDRISENIFNIDMDSLYYGFLWDEQINSYVPGGSSFTKYNPVFYNAKVKPFGSNNGETNLFNSIVEETNMAIDDMFNAIPVFSGLSSVNEEREMYQSRYLKNDITLYDVLMDVEERSPGAYWNVYPYSNYGTLFFGRRNYEYKQITRTFNIEPEKADSIYGYIANQFKTEINKISKNGNNNNIEFPKNGTNSFLDLSEENLVKYNIKELLPSEENTGLTNYYKIKKNILKYKDEISTPYIKNIAIQLLDGGTFRNIFNIFRTGGALYDKKLADFLNAEQRIKIKNKIEVPEGEMKNNGANKVYISSGKNLIKNNISINRNFYNTIRVSFRNSWQESLQRKFTGRNSSAIELKLYDGLPDENKRVKFVDGESKDISTQQQAFEVGLSHLQKEVSKIYQGDILITFNGEITYNKEILLLDTENNMFGNLYVQDYQHLFTKNGLVTKITPKMKTESTSLLGDIKTMAFYQRMIYKSFSDTKLRITDSENAKEAKKTINRFLATEIQQAIPLRFETSLSYAVDEEDKKKTTTPKISSGTYLPIDIFPLIQYGKMLLPNGEIYGLQKPPIIYAWGEFANKIFEQIKENGFSFDLNFEIRDMFGDFFTTMLLDKTGTIARMNELGYAHDETNRKFREEMRRIITSSNYNMIDNYDGFDIPEPKYGKINLPKISTTIPSNKISNLENEICFFNTKMLFNSLFEEGVESDSQYNFTKQQYTNYRNHFLAKIISVYGIIGLVEIDIEKQQHKKIVEILNSKFSDNKYKFVDGVLNDNELGVIIYNEESKYKPISDGEIINLSVTYDEETKTRNLFYQDFQIKNSDKKIRYMVFHNYYGGDSYKDHKIKEKFLTKVKNILNNQDIPTLIGGDFNIEINKSDYLLENFDYEYPLTVIDKPTTISNDGVKNSYDNFLLSKGDFEYERTKDSASVSFYINLGEYNYKKTRDFISDHLPIKIDPLIR